MKRLSVFCYVMLTIFLMGIFPANAAEIRITGNKLSLHADQAPLQTILQQMARQGVHIQVDPRINPEISAHFDNRDIQRGLDSILRSLNHVLIWEGVRGKQSVRLSEIQIFKPGQKSRMRSLNPPLELVSKDGILFVKNEMLIRLKTGMSLEELENLLAKIGGTIIEQNTALGVYKIRFPDDIDILEFSKILARHPGIDASEPNYAYPINAPYKVTGMAGSDTTLAQISTPKGKISIAVLDTGLSEAFASKDFVLNSMDVLNPGGEISDTQGHGTQMALIASGAIEPYGVSADDETDNPVIAIKAFDENGYISSYNMMESIDFALDNGAKVMSLSWGSENDSEFMETAMEYASSQGLIIVASAGNEATGKPVYPAAYPSVIGVGALGPDGKTWENSNYGSFVNVYAPGFASLPVGYNGDPGEYAGTSISAAYVANQIASYLSDHPGATSQEIFEALEKQ